MGVRRGDAASAEAVRCRNNTPRRRRITAEDRPLSDLRTDRLASPDLSRRTPVRDDSPVLEFEPSIKTLIAFGGLQYLLTIDQGEWYRIFSGPLLHANLPHILGNGVALLLAGYALERAVGRLWFAALFVIGALGGACGSLLVNPHNLVTVGASGAIMGLFAAILVISVRYTNKQDRLGLQRRAINVLIPSLLPLFSAKGGRVDYAAHAGGAAAGAVAAYVLLKLWREIEFLASPSPSCDCHHFRGIAGWTRGRYSSPSQVSFLVSDSPAHPIGICAEDRFGCSRDP